MPSAQISNITGRAFHLSGDDIDTDRIIPARFLRCITFDGLEDHVFEDDRKQSNGSHPFDNPKNKGCEILIADVNFGCGSSREHAVAAIQRWGIKAIIAKSFAAIFRGNATANGLVCVELNDADMLQLLQFEFAAPNTEVSVDLVLMEIACTRGASRNSWKCTMPPADRDMLVSGTWDTTATLLDAGDAIEKTAVELPYVGTFG